MSTEFSINSNPSPELFQEIVQLVGTTEGWAFQNEDLDIWNSLESHDLFFVLRNNSEFVASISVAKQYLKKGNEILYSIAFFYCVEQYRNRGFGRVLFDLVKDIYKDANVTLFGVGTMWKWYLSNYNFKVLQPYFHASSTVYINDLVLNKISENCGARDIAEKDWMKIHEYDSQICEIDRRKMMRMWMTASNVFSKIIEKNNKIVGFGTIRIVSLNRLMISPLYAESADYAKAIILGIIKDIPNLESFESIGAVYPYENEQMDEIMFDLSNGHFKKSEFCRSQFTKRRLNVDTTKVFAIRHCAHSYV